MTDARYAEGGLGETSGARLGDVCMKDVSHAFLTSYRIRRPPEGLQGKTSTLSI